MKPNLTAIEKTIQVLKTLSEQPYEFSATQLSNILGFNRTTIHRILNSLENEMFIIRNESNKTYSIGPSLYHVGVQYLNRKSNYTDIKSIIDEASKEVGQSIGYTIIVNKKIINIYESETYYPIRIRYQQGDYYPINCGAYGKTIMAFYEPIEDLEKIVYQIELVKKTKNSITDPVKLLKEYEKIRKNGYAISDEENILGAIGVGAPVFNSSGKIHGALAAAVVKNTLNKKELDTLINVIIDGAKKISKYIL